MRVTTSVLSTLSLALQAQAYSNYSGSYSSGGYYGGRESCAFSVGKQVRTTSGTVLGHRAPNATQVSEYLGIPFAVPPLGPLRFAPPVPYTSHRHINASLHGANCPSTSATVPEALSPPSLYNLLADLGQVNDTQNEDCLYVNVWSKPQSGSALKPVLVWIYGGGFNSGGTNSSAYSGQHWADEEDVVFVNFNYRLNVFGFPGAEVLEQNVGLLDQRLAVEWVRTNIGGFGGDPTRITIFGESAGGASVDYYNYAWTKDPIIAGSIAQSGTATSFGNRGLAAQQEAWASVAARVGCNQTNPAQVLSCMRSPNVTMTALLNAASAGTSGLASVLGSFGPTIDNRTVFANYTDRALKGQYIQNPSIFGNNYFEAGLFILLGAGSGASSPLDFWRSFDQTIFTCPITTAARWRAEVGRLPTWRYIYRAVFPNIRLPTDMGEAWHGAELLPLFGTSEVVTKQDSTWQERALGSYMRSAWSAFAHDPEYGLETFGWRRFDGQGGRPSVLQLGFGETNSTTFEVEPSYNTTMAYDTGCPAFPG